MARFCRSRRASLLVPILALWILGLYAPDKTLVERISFSETGEGDGYVMRIHAEDMIRAYWSPEVHDARIVEFRLFDVELSESFEQDAPVELIEEVEVDREGEFLIFRLHLASDGELDVAAYRDRHSNDVLLSLRAVEPAGESLETAPPVAEAGPSDPGAEPPVGEEESGDLESRPQPGEAPDMVRGSGDRWRLDTIVIDAGHGGHDAGAMAHGVREKDVTLAVALQLGAYIEEEFDEVDVVYTREDDSFVELEERGHIANEAGGKLFISIHANSAGNRAAQGAETWFLGPARTEDARRVMERENRVIQLEDNPERYDDFYDENLVVQAMAQSAYLRNSEVLGDLVQKQFAERVHRTNRGVKQSEFIVLWAASMPAVLVELGFLSNPNEARFLSGEQGQAYMASAIFRAVRDYKEQYDRGIAVSN